MVRLRRRGRNLVILAAPGGLLAGVRDALQDWSAVGLVQPLLLGGGPTCRGSRSGRGTRDRRGQAIPMSLAELLPRRPSQRIRLCVLVPAFQEASALDKDAENKLAELIRLSTGSGVEQEFIRW